MNRKLIFFIALLACLALPLGHLAAQGNAPAAAEIEPNDTPAQATPIALGLTTANNDSAADVDWFKLNLTAVAIALPVTLVLLVVQFVSGVLSRSAPALNLFALGLPAGVLAGLAALIVAAPLASEQLADLSAEAVTHAGEIIAR